MTGWNLPPGVNVSDIPGNRPEDIAEEEFWMKLGEKLDEAKVVAISDLPAAPSANSVSLDDLWDNVDFVKIIQEARNLGYIAGYNDGTMEAEMAMSMKMLDEQEGKFDNA